jgi:hypothetical protein
MKAGVPASKDGSPAFSILRRPLSRMQFPETPLTSVTAQKRTETGKGSLRKGGNRATRSAKGGCPTSGILRKRPNERKHPDLRSKNRTPPRPSPTAEYPPAAKPHAQYAASPRIRGKTELDQKPRKKRQSSRTETNSVRGDSSKGRHRAVRTLAAAPLNRPCVARYPMWPRSTYWIRTSRKDDKSQS